ncbi:MAG: helix-turn-helix domain-containing protein, partial [bacterium]|nr:helix-turn-helix domain-containing protein [bacterium]
MGEKNKKIKYISLAEATKYCDYSQEYLSLLARRGLMPAVKIGRNWFTTREDLVHYIQKTAIHNGEIDSQSIALVDAAKEFGLSIDYLRDLALKGNFRAEQVGQAWFTTRQDIENYFKDFPRPVKKISQFQKEHREDIAPNVRNVGIFASRPILRFALGAALALLLAFLNIFMITEGAMAKKGGNFKKVVAKMSGGFAIGARSAIKGSRAMNNASAEKTAALAQSLQATNQKISNGIKKQITQSGQEKVLTTIKTARSLPAYAVESSRRASQKTAQFIADTEQAISDSVSDKKIEWKEAIVSFPEESQQAGENFKDWFGQVQEEIIVYREEQSQAIKDLPQNLEVIKQTALKKIAALRDQDDQKQAEDKNGKFLENAGISGNNFLEWATTRVWSTARTAPARLQNWGSVLVDNTPLAIEGAADLAEKGKDEAFSWPADLARAGRATWQSLIATGEEITRLPASARRWQAG